ncbi:MAG TPA: STAS domain-containing protein [Candidatus Sulfotelmatobacter sp.]|nr:STAS domain-containing protein [Candidatus Sulfotelmatobacter sp.]HKT87159.1 STAS domain-containing protein [Candidatus Sulfotelmatobacter sp.]
MQLRLESRPIGEVFVVQCHGRLVAGNEVFTLHSQIGDAIDKYGDVVLQLDHLEFVDSSGLGAMMRLVQAARSKGGDVKLSGIPPRIRKILQLTHLLPQFESYDSMEEAITAAYLGSKYSRGKAGDVRPKLLCVYASTDVCTFLREVLCSVGFNALTTTVIDDAQILLKATKAKLVVLSNRIQSLRGRPVRQALLEIAPDVQILVLDENFASGDPGEAAEKLLQDVSRILTPQPN